MGTEGLEPSRQKLVNGFSIIILDYLFTNKKVSSFRLVSAPTFQKKVGSRLENFFP